MLGIVIGSSMMRVIDNGINMFQIRYQDQEGTPRLWRLNPNWTFIIVGTVILVAVILDQVVHMVQAARRIRHAGAAAVAASPPAGGTEGGTAGGGIPDTGTDAARAKAG